jgi:hypothetical protein
MLRESMFEELDELKDLQDIILVGRFSYEKDINDLVMYGFADPDWKRNERKFELGDNERIFLNSSNPEMINADLVEPQYLAMCVAKDFIIAGNGMHSLFTKEAVLNNKTTIREQTVLFSIIDNSFTQKHVFQDENGNKIYANSFKQDRLLSPRIQGLMFSGYKSEDTKAATAYIKANRLYRAAKGIFPVIFNGNTNFANAIATFYHTGKTEEINGIDLSGWDKSQYTPHEYQNALTDLLFEKLGENAVGAASILSYPKNIYIKNREK